MGEAKVEKGSVLAPKSLPDATPILLDNGIEATIHWTAEHWLDDSIAYAPQQSFIRHGTLRDNILFGQPMWRERYQEALRQAALLPDLEILEDGDMTEVGENGVTLVSPTVFTSSLIAYLGIEWWPESKGQPCALHLLPRFNYLP